MKPRIYLHNKLWYCVAQHHKSGLGFTPADAYREWVARNRSAV